MRRIFLGLLIILICNICFAQELVTVHESFDQNKFNWDESFTENGTAVLINNMLKLENNSDAIPISSICNLPISSDEDFTASVVLNKPQINEEDYVGIVFNYEDEFNYYVFLVREREACIGRYHDGKFRRIRTNPIILQKGDKNDVILLIQRKGKNIIFSIDNMEVKKHPIDVINNTFGVILFGEGELSVSSVEIKRYDNND